MSVPIVGSDRVLGSVQLENHEREHAFGESEVRLLQTVAASMGVALENARLFDETQRLLKETEQRAAELAVINSIQQGMAGELDFQAIVDLVGDKLREVLKTRRHRHRLARPADRHAAPPLRVRARPAAEHPAERTRAGRTVRDDGARRGKPRGPQHRGRADGAGQSPSCPAPIVRCRR